ncbi:hypothetical protein EN885_30575 [Mesorhizobium sp. M6A.T.Cr.TU.014.01.1.1]|nr:hypothetical protein EN885_30575 [Mesorhizobium sp. M6A.T.Cr.TU.014.01.1.1]RWP97802.1 MAG: hypothetical protein EOR90_27510 [Mesorhizobium sp.]RWP98726.1 MAG: hypothetical protein EOR91_27740 [Mesorhizobium sp.]
MRVQHRIERLRARSCAIKRAPTDAASGWTTTWGADAGGADSTKQGNKNISDDASACRGPTSTLNALHVDSTRYPHGVAFMDGQYLPMSEISLSCSLLWPSEEWAPRR